MRLEFWKALLSHGTHMLVGQGYWHAAQGGEVTSSARMEDWPKLGIHGQVIGARIGFS